MRALFGLTCAFVAFVFTLYSYVKETAWQARSERVFAVVESISARNSSCGSKSKRSCTIFSAALRYRAESTGRDHTLHTQAGDANDHNQPTAYADLKQGQQIAIRYARENPDDACRDTWGEIHRGSKISGFIVVVALLIGFAPSKKRYHRRRSFRLW